MRLVVEIRLDNIQDDLRHLCIVKGNYLGQEHKNQSYVLRMTDGQTFENTGRRLNFEDLKQDPNGGKKEAVIQMRLEGLPFREITKKTGVSIATISRWTKQ